MKIIYIIIVVHGGKTINWEKFTKNIKYSLKKNVSKLNKVFINYIIKKKLYLIDIIIKGVKRFIYNYIIIPMFIAEGGHINNDLKITLNNIIKIYNNIKLFKTNCISKKKNIINLLVKNYTKNINYCTKQFKKY